MVHFNKVGPEREMRHTDEEAAEIERNIQFKQMVWCSDLGGTSPVSASVYFVSINSSLSGEAEVATIASQCIWWPNLITTVTWVAELGFAQFAAVVALLSTVLQPP